MLRYPGGKTRAISILNEILTVDEKQELTNKIIYSPFFGGGSFELFLSEHYNCEIHANDLFKPLISFWNTTKNNPVKLTDAVKKLKPLNKEKFTQLRNTIMNESSELKQAASYFAINRSSFSGATLSGGFSEQAAKGRFNDNAISKINTIDLSKITFYNQSWEEFLKQIPDNDNTILFLDPPYLLGKGSKLYGVKGDLHDAFDHKALAKALSKRKRWLLCYNDSPSIRNLYPNADMTFYEVDWSYGMNKSKKSSELVIARF